MPTVPNPLYDPDAPGQGLMGDQAARTTPSNILMAAADMHSHGVLTQQPSLRAPRRVKGPKGGGRTSPMTK